MADDKARIEAELVGANQVAGEARKIENSLVGAGSNIEKKLGGALKSVTGGLASMVKGGLAAAGVLEGISLARAVEQVKQLDTATMRLGVTSGYTSSSLQSHFDGLEKKILTSSMAQADFARGLGRLTYDSKGAVDGVDALGTVALATGQTLEEQAGFGKALKSMQTPIADAVGEMDKLRGVADALGLQGGVQALKDDLSKLEPVLQGVNLKTEEAQNKFRGLMGILAKGQTPERGAQTQAATMSFLRGNAIQIERMTGRKVLDEYGNMIDPTANLKDLSDLSKRQFGGNDRARRLSLQAWAGEAAGLALFRGGFEDAGKVGASSKPGQTAADAAAAAATEAAERERRRLEADAARRGAARPLVEATDGLASTLGPWGMMALGGALNGGGGLLGGMLKGAFGGGGAVAGGGGGGLAAGGGLLGPLALLGGVALGQLAATASLGKDRGQMGQEWRNEHAKTIGAELANKAAREGMISPEIYGNATRDGNEALKVLLEKLADRKDDVGEQARQMAQAMKEVFAQEGVTLKINAVAAPRNANAAGGAGNGAL